MTDFALAAAAYFALLLATCYGVSVLLKVLTSAEAVQAFNEIAVRIAE